MNALSRRTFLHQLGLGTTGAFLGTSLARSASGGAGLAGLRPNILLLLADDLGFSDVGCFGADVIETPHLDRLGFGGMRCTQFYNNAKCAPTRASLLTGLYSQQVGCHGPPVVMRNGATLAEVLRPAGYHTSMTGKWHAGETPTERGFERFFGLLGGESNYFNPGLPRAGEPAPANYRPGQPPRWGIDGKVYDPWTPDDPDFFTTDAFTDYTIRYVREAAAARRPFFSYLSYTAPHFPLQAHREDIAKYRGRFRDGWDVQRERRHRRQLDLGLVDPRWRLPERDEDVPAWADVDGQDDWDLRMAVYAAMIDRMDRNIGRVMRVLEETGQAENTLTVFLSDNGGCAESHHRTPGVDPGPIDSFRTLDKPWANVTNTPFRKFKQWDHEGGISSPTIFHWPGRIAPGRIVHDTGHVIDLMPTCLNLADAVYPSENDNGAVLPCAGLDFLPVLEGRGRRGHEGLAWEFGPCSAVRRGRWKAVRTSPKTPWKLYDLEEDRTETRNLAAAHPDIVAGLNRDYRAWAARVGARN